MHGSRTLLRKVSAWVLWSALLSFSFLGLVEGDWSVGRGCTSIRRLLVKGAPVQGGSFGIIFDAEDQLHIASLFANEVVVMDRESGRIVNRLGPEQGVEGPDDVFVSKDGSVFWTAVIKGDVVRLLPTGETKILANLGPGVNPITMSEDGRLFVGKCFFGPGLFEVDPEGVQPPRSVTEALNDECTINGMDFGPDGRLYGPRFFNDTVVAIDVDTGDIEVIAQDFGSPDAVKFNSRGVMHVLAAGSRALFQVDIASGEKVMLAQLPDDTIPDNIAIDSDDRIFISYNNNGMIQELLPDGSLRVVSPPGMTNPTGMAVLSRARRDSVFVSTLTSLIEFDGVSGEQISNLVTDLAEPVLQSPQTIATDGRNLLMASSFGTVVQIWDPSSMNLMSTFTDFEVPANAIFFKADIVVSEWEAERVVLASVSNSSQRTVLAEGLGSFSGLVATEDSVWGVTWKNGTLYQLVKDGIPLSEPLTIVTGMQRPEGMAVWGSGRLLVVETGTGKLLLIDPESGEQVVVADGLALGGQGVGGITPIFPFSDVAVGQSGIVYVQSDVKNEVYRIKIIRCD